MDPQNTKSNGFDKLNQAERSIIQKVDTNSPVIILDKYSYNKKMIRSNKIQSLDISSDKQLNISLNFHEKLKTF